MPKSKKRFINGERTEMLRRIRSVVMDDFGSDVFVDMSVAERGDFTSIIMREYRLRGWSRARDIAIALTAEYLLGEYESISGAMRDKALEKYGQYSHVLQEDDDDED